MDYISGVLPYIFLCESTFWVLETETEGLDRVSNAFLRFLSFQLFDTFILTKIH